jgi:hypothetical protein
MSNAVFDEFGIVKMFPDLEDGVTVIQNDPEWKERYTKHGYSSPKLKNATVWRKTFSFSRKLKPDQEVTIYVSLPGLNPEYGKFDGIGPCQSGSGLSIKLRGSTHPKVDKKTPDKVLKKTAKCYIFHYEYEGGDCKNFQKEYPHPEYSKYTFDEKTAKKFKVEYGGNSFPDWRGKVMGFKAALLNTDDGKKVEFWSWFDESAKLDENDNVIPGNWLLRYHGTDEAQFVDKDNPRTKPPFLTCHGNYTEFRMDNAVEDTKAFCASLREIKRS